MTNDRFMDIPVMRPILPTASEVLPFLQGMDERKWYSNRGPLVTLLEEQIARHLGVAPEHTVICSSATLALQAACSLSPARGFHVPTFTFPASVLAALNAGKRVSLTDIRDSDWQINMIGQPNQNDWGLLRVLPFGAPVTLHAFTEWEHVVIDAAASLGSDQRDLSGLPENWSVVFSMHATKVLGMGEGGVLVTGSAARAERVRAWINFGFAGSRGSQIVGTNAKVSEMAAAYGIASFANWSHERAEWHEANSLARAAARSLGIASIVSDYVGVTPYWIAQFADAETTARVEAQLRRRSIGTRRWWENGCHRMLAFSDIVAGPYPVTEDLAGKTLGLPMFRGVTAEQFASIASIIEANL